MGSSLFGPNLLRHSSLQYTMMSSLPSYGAGSRDLKSGGKVVSERPISREELASTGSIKSEGGYSGYVGGSRAVSGGNSGVPVRAASGGYSGISGVTGGISGSRISSGVTGGISGLSGGISGVSGGISGLSAGLTSSTSYSGGYGGASMTMVG